MNRQKGTLVSKKYIVGLILVLCLLVLFFPAPVKGQNTVLIEESEPMCVLDVCEETSSNQSLATATSMAEFGGQPYIGAYMTTDYIGYDGRGDNANALGVTVSFIGTDKSVIQSDNWLMAGITGQGPDWHYDQCAAIDWGYTFSLVVDGIHSDPFLHAEVWECHEWGDDCIPPWWAKCVSSWSSFIPGVTISSSVTLTMEWSEDTLDYYAKVGETTYHPVSYTPNETASHYFMTGTVGRQWPFPGRVKWLQFHGAWSKYNIGQVGWHSWLRVPRYLKTGDSSWTDVSFAYSTDGPNAFLDNTMVWGGLVYNSVNGYSGHKYVHFSYNSQGITLPPDTLLWAPVNGGGGSCPYVYTWDGQGYVMDNNVLPAAEHSNGADVEDYYKLEQLLAPTHQGTHRSDYSLQIREFENEHDYFDHVKLLAVDHSSDVNVAVTPYGEILTYSNPAPPMSAFDENGADVQSLLSYVDENYYQGYNGSYVNITFASTDVSNGIKLVIREDGPLGPPLLKSPVYIQVVNATGDWNSVAVFHTRTYWATDIINMTGYLPDANGDLKVRFCFVSNDKIDYVGLDTTPEANIEMHQANLISAFHSTQGNVKPLLIKNDQTYAELIPGEQIQLTFLLPNNENQERTFILYTEGHYEAIG